MLRTGSCLLLLIMLVTGIGQAVASPLHDAARAGKVNEVFRLIKSGANVNKRDRLGETPVFKTGNVTIIEGLYQAGAYLDVKNNNRQTPLHHAIQKGWTDAATTLIDKGADINARDRLGSTPLMLAVQAGNVAQSRTLVQKGADVNAKNKFGETALFDAMTTEKLVIANFLVKKRAAIRATNKNGATLLHRAAGIRQNTATIEWLLKRRLDVNARKKDGNTALHEAARIGSLKNVSMLVELGGDVNKQNQAGRSVMYYAVRSNNRTLVDFLLKRGARVNKGDFDHCQRRKVLGNRGLVGYVVRCFNKKEYYTDRNGRRICIGKSYRNCFR